MKFKLYHNPRCRKSREALQWLQEHGHNPEVVEYLKTPPSEAEIDHLLNKLGLEPEELVRKGEAVYKEAFKDRNLNRADWLKALHNHPILIERPIVVSGNRAIIARPASLLEEWLKG
jgi:arsenate reductase (glutaredoxin)